MKKLMSAIFTLFVFTGCTNPLGDSSVLEDRFSPGYEPQPQSENLAGFNLNFSHTPVAGEAVNLQIRALDAEGNILTSYAGAVLVTSSDLTASFQILVSFSSSNYGQLTMPVIFRTAGSQSLTINTQAAPHFSASLNPNVLAGNASKLSFTRSPAAGQVGTLLTPSVLVQALDAYNNLVSSFNGSVTVALGNNPTSTSLLGTLSRSAVSGVAEFADLQIDDSGTGYTLRASAVGLSSVDSSAFNITQLAPSQLAILSQPSSSSATSLLSATLQLRDVNGHNVTVAGISVSVSLSGGTSGASLEGTTTVTTNSDGQAIFNDLQIKKMGSGYTLAFASSGFSTLTSTSFSIFPGLPSVAHSTLTSTVSSIFADGADSAQILIVLKDQYDNPLSNTAVSLLSPSSGVVIHQPSSNTNADGETTASVTATSAGTKVLSFNTPAGLSSVTASISALALNMNQTWNYNSSFAGSYTLSGSSLQFTSTHLHHRNLAVDSDNDPNFGFAAAANSSNTTWSVANGMHLNASGLSSGSGGFTSRHIESNMGISWTGISMTSLVPAGKRYPDNRGVETAYSSNNLDMSGNLVLLHFDETTWDGVNYDVLDTSGRSHSGKIGGTVTSSTDAKFGRSAYLNNGYIEIPSATELSGMARLSLEAWIKPAIGSITGDPSPIISYREGATSSTNPNYAYTVFAYTGKAIHIDINGHGNRYNTGYLVQENIWQHIAVTFDGPTRVITLYVNGVSVWSQTISPSAIQNVSTAAASFYVGRMKAHANFFRGHLDEVAVYSRTLTPAEISARYQRGVTRLKMQVRACASLCSSESFVGPDGTSASYFSEFSNTGLSNITNFTLSGLTSRRDFQYKMTLETDNALYTPKLSSIAVTPSVYDIGSPYVTSSAVSYVRLKSFTPASGGTGSLRYQLLNNDVPYYYNGSAWVAATTINESNTASQVSAQIESFHVDTGTGSLKVRAIFGSGSDGTDQSSLSSITVTGSQ